MYLNINYVYYSCKGFLRLFSDTKLIADNIYVYWDSINQEVIFPNQYKL